MKNKLIRAEKIENYINDNNFENIYNSLFNYLNKNYGIICCFGTYSLECYFDKYDNKLILYVIKLILNSLEPAYYIFWVLDSKYDEDYLLNLIIRFRKLQCFY